MTAMVKTIAADIHQLRITAATAASNAPRTSRFAWPLFKLPSESGRIRRKISGLFSDANLSGTPARQVQLRAARKKKTLNSHHEMLASFAGNLAMGAMAAANNGE